MGQVPNVPRFQDITATQIRDLVGDAPLLVEVGCNDGQDTARFLEAMPDARIFCFECDPRAIRRFQDNRLAAESPRVTLIKCAISDRNGSLSFHQSGGKSTNPKLPMDDWDLSGSLRRPTGHLRRHPWCQFSTVVEVDALTLDTWANMEPRVQTVDFMWWDVQGAEALCILGGVKLLRRTRYLYTEYYDDPLYDRQADLYGLLCFLPDFDLVGIYGENALFKNRTL